MFTIFNVTISLASQYNIFNSLPTLVSPADYLSLDVLYQIGGPDKRVCHLLLLLLCLWRLKSQTRLVWQRVVHGDGGKWRRRGGENKIYEEKDEEDNPTQNGLSFSQLDRCQGKRSLCWKCRRRRAVQIGDRRRRKEESHPSLDL